MAISTVFQQPKASTTTTRTMSDLTAKLFEDSSNGRFLVHIYVTVNGQLRLIQAVALTPEVAAINYRCKVTSAEFSANGATTYDPTSLSTANAAPFVYPSTATPLDKGYTVNTNLNTLYVNAGVSA
jgi:hypothetical protein